MRRITLSYFNHYYRNVIIKKRFNDLVYRLSRNSFEANETISDFPEILLKTLAAFKYGFFNNEHYFWNYFRQQIFSSLNRLRNDHKPIYLSACKLQPDHFQEYMEFLNTQDRKLLERIFIGRQTLREIAKEDSVCLATVFNDKQNAINRLRQRLIVHCV